MAIQHKNPASLQNNSTLIISVGWVQDKDTAECVESSFS